MTRLKDLKRFYRLMTRLERNTGGRCALGQIERTDCPDRGVYFFFDEGEGRSGSGSGDRIVRVGSHALRAGQRTTVWSRIAKHKGVQRLGGRQPSVFRHLVGNAICLRNGRLGPENWPHDADRGDVIRIEKLISRHMWPMTVLLLPVGRRSHRDSIERNAIGLLSEYREEDPIDPPSRRWLGLRCNREKVRVSGLWNIEHVAGGYEPKFLDRLEAYVDRARN